MKYTIAMSLGAVKMFCKGSTMKSIQFHYGITEGNTLVRKGVWALVEKYNLEVQKDNEATVGFVLTKEDKDTLYDLADNEIVVKRASEQKTLDSLVDKPFLMQQIEALHRERQMLKRWFDCVNDRILKIERHIKSKNNL